MTVHSPWGWMPSPKDSRDYRYQSPAGGKLTEIPEGELSAEEHILSILNQGSRPTCVAHAVAQQIRAERHRKGIPSPPLTSRAFMHYASRAQHAHPTTPGGTYFRAAYKSGKVLGLPLEESYPYIAGYEIQMPDTEAFHNGFDFRKEFEYRLIDFTGNDLINAIDDLLYMEKTVVCGIPVTEYWERGDYSKGPAPAPESDKDLPLHGILIGKRDKTGNYLGPNSWSEDYGLAGWFWMTREYLQKHGREFRYLEAKV